MDKKIPQIINAYIMVDKTQVFCCINKQEVKLFPIGETIQIFFNLFHEKTYKGSFFHGFDENNCNISIHVTSEPEIPIFAQNVVFYTGAIVKSFANGCPDKYDCGYFNKISFQGGIVNSLFSPERVIANNKALYIWKDDDDETKGKMAIEFEPFCKTDIQKSISLFGQVVELSLGTNRPGTPAMRKGNSQSLDLGEINSLLTLTFAEKQPITEFIKFHNLFQKLFSFLAVQNNIWFETSLEIPDKKGKGYNDSAHCYIFDNFENYCEMGSRRVIPIENLMDNIEKLLNVFSSQREYPYLQFLPSNNKEIGSIDFNKIRDLCTAFEKEFGLSNLKLDKVLERLISELKTNVKNFAEKETIDKGTLDLVNGAIGHLSNPLRSKMRLMYENYKNIIDEIFSNNKIYKNCSFSEDEFQKFVKLRNDITHAGNTLWSDNVGIVYSIVEVMIYLACFDRMGVNIDLVKKSLFYLFAII